MLKSAKLPHKCDLGDSDMSSTVSMVYENYSWNASINNMSNYTYLISKCNFSANASESLSANALTIIEL